MTRRLIALLITLALGLLMVPLATRAQPATPVHRIGVLTGYTPGRSRNVEAFLEGVRALGYVEGQNLVLEYRGAVGQFERFPALAAELVRLPADVLLVGGTPAALAAKDAPPLGRVYRLGIVVTASPKAQMMDSGTGRDYQAFYGELRRLGYEEGQNLIVERWSAEGQPERYPDIVAEAVRRTPDVILTASSRLAHLLQAATTTIPIVALTADPIATHVVTDLARPGGNLTGLSVDAGEELRSKQLELLHEALPGLARVAFLAVSRPPGWRRLLEGGRQLGVTVQHVQMDGPYQEAQYVAAFQTMAEHQAQAVLVLDQPEHATNRQHIVELATRHRLPGMYPSREYVEVGGLMSYGTNRQDLWRRAAGHVDRIFRGAKAGDLPFEQPTMFELVINLKTANALGLTIPPTLLFQATEVLR